MPIDTLDVKRTCHCEAEAIKAMSGGAVKAGQGNQGKSRRSITLGRDRVFSRLTPLRTATDYSLEQNPVVGAWETGTVDFGRL
jgi:hypothetical protein